MDALLLSNYAAARCGEAATGRVHSVFSSSLNIMLGDFLLHVGPSSAPLSCLGAAVAPQEMAHLLMSVQPGDEARLRDGCLRIYSRAAVSELALDAAEVRALDVLGAGEGPQGLAVAADAHLYRALGELDLPGRIGLPWPDRSQAAVSDLVRFSVACLARCSVASGEVVVPGGTDPEVRYEGALRAMRSAVAYLVGRGLGLTPSGDDVLMGFGCALRFLYGSSAESPAAPFFQEVAAVAPGKTTAVSQAYLDAMAAGYANEDYLELLACIRAGAWDALPVRIVRVLALGHTSGADGLMGFGAAFGCLL